MQGQGLSSNLAGAGDDGDDFGSVAWETRPHHDASTATPALDPADNHATYTSSNQHGTGTTSTSNYHNYGANAATSPSSTHLTTAVHSVQVKDGKIELEGTSDTFVSYLVSAKVSPALSLRTCNDDDDDKDDDKEVELSSRPQTDLSHYASTTPSSRRRFQDFKVMREMLVRDFPAAVVPPLPDKHRMGELSMACRLRSTAS